MYISQMLKTGYKILTFDKETIKHNSNPKFLEDCFFSNLLFNYLLVLIFFLFYLSTNSYSIGLVEVNRYILLSVLLVYPFIYNLVIYIFYSIFGLLAEFIKSKNKVKSFMTIGYYTGVFYSIIFYILALLVNYNYPMAVFISIFVFIYFIISIFIFLKEIYKLSTLEINIVILLFFMFLFLIFSLLIPVFNFFL